MIVLDWKLKRMEWYGVDSSGSELEQVAGSSEHGDGTSSSIQFWEFLA
jgi:hypothetical protein